MVRNEACWRGDKRGPKARGRTGEPEGGTAEEQEEEEEEKGGEDSASTEADREEGIRGRLS